jgi:hypothetical protein
VRTTTLSTSIGRSLDRVFASIPELAPFAKLKASGQDLRRFFHDTGQAQREIAFYRDKWWSRQKGPDSYFQSRTGIDVLVASHGGVSRGDPRMTLDIPDSSPQNAPMNRLFLQRR